MSDNNKWKIPTLVRYWCKKFGLDTRLVYAMIYQESSGNPYLDEADSKYASVDSINKIKDDVAAFKDSMTIQYNGIMQGVIDFQTNTSNRIDTINDRLDTFATLSL